MTTTVETSRNRLADEPSLYLRQHADNPVHWYPWCEDALERARAENKPILLSIGYSACHWCHVMERESFENPDIASLMNELYVCVKVDREERPDLDHLYMKAVQGMTGRGGWPMTVFLTPDAKPYFAGTYFPPDDRPGMPGFPRVLVAAARAYHDEPDRVTESADRVAEFLGRNAGPAADCAAFSAEHLLAAAAALVTIMDGEHGGFGQEPKFPGSMCLSLLMAAETEQGDEERTRLVRLALDRMADGGIYDHLGGGFHRYSVDRVWLVPHFEKMLYDQALLAALYADAWRLYGDDRYREVTLGVLDYVAREMTAPEGGFYATQDADSEGVEGKYFVWSREEIEEVLGPEDAPLICGFFGVTEGGNFEEANILHRSAGLAELATDHGCTPEAVRSTIAAASAKLLGVRERRVKPARDEKILADWNGLMIASMASVGRLFDRPDLVELAARAADFVRANMMEDGRLRHFFADGQTRVDGFLDDYAFFGRGCLELYYASGRTADLSTATACARILVDEFEDRESGGFWFTGDGGQSLVARTREFYDGALPAGNSVAAELLLRLYALTGEQRFLESGRRCLDAGLAAAVENPHGGSHLLCVAERQRRGYATVIVAGKVEDSKALVSAALERPCFDASVLAVTDGEAPGQPDLVVGKKPIDGQAAAYVCRGQICLEPATSPSALADRMTMRSQQGD